MKVSLIAAVAENGVIGAANTLPWKIKADMRFFKAKTEGHVVITGRKNFDAMGRALPKRDNIVVTRDPDFSAPNVTVARNIEEALRMASAKAEVEAFVIGGAQIYALAFPYATTLYRTRVLANVAGDVVFPAFDEADWTKRELDRHDRDAENEHAFVIEELTRSSLPRSYV
ncbi:MAG TPA: dihydrofolate reductase [Polyangiaceae bacterium]|jgi:dihydrofolate reductase|nr:dihydrofolate reductase [Polyangiaceae bacterium]